MAVVTFLPAIECVCCHTVLDHDDPTWVAPIINGQPTPLCELCVVLAGHTREGVAA